MSARDALKAVSSTNRSAEPYSKELFDLHIRIYLDL